MLYWINFDKSDIQNFPLVSSVMMYTIPKSISELYEWELHHTLGVVPQYVIIRLWNLTATDPSIKNPCNNSILVLFKVALSNCFANAYYEITFSKHSIYFFIIFSFENSKSALQVMSCLFLSHSSRLVVI